MNELPLISIVLPVYNVQEYIEQCIESLLKEDFPSEILLIDDGSTDNSGTICDQYASTYSKVKVFHKKNGGPSSARNCGIENAKGSYLLFVDADDYIKSGYINKLYREMTENECDLIMSGYFTIPDNCKIPPLFPFYKILKGKDFVLSCEKIHTSLQLCPVWRSIYKRELIDKNRIRFNESVNIGEDFIFNLEYLLSCQSVMAIPDCFYCYRVNNNSLMRQKKYKPFLESSLLKQFEIRDYLSENYGLYKNQYYMKDMSYYYINSIFSLLLNNIRNSDSLDKKKDVYRIIRYPMFRKSLKRLGFNYNTVNWKEYMFFLALKFKIDIIIQRYV